MKMKNLIMLRTVLIVLILVGVTYPVYANGTFPPHRPPIEGEEWISPSTPSHNHNTYIQWDMENIRNQPTPQYDGYASWYMPPGGGVMSFHASGVSPGENHNDGVRFGHGFIPSSNPVCYQYSSLFLDNSPLGALADIDTGFLEWDTAINSDPGPYRKPGSILGFDWRRAALLEDFEITVNWKYQTYGEGYDEYDDKNGNGRYDLGELITNDTHNIGTFDSVPTYAWVIPDAYPTLEFFDGWWTDGVFLDAEWFFGGSALDDPPCPGDANDFYTTALHELGHLVGLDDLYDLDLGYPGSIMGTGVYGVMRDPDFGSIQGGVDLYTIPEPATLVLLGIGGLILRRQRRQTD